MCGDGLASIGYCRLAFRRRVHRGGLRGGGLGVAVKGSDLVFGIFLYRGTRALTEGLRFPGVLFFLFILVFLFGHMDGAAMGEAFLFEAEAGGGVVGAAERDEIAADARHGGQLVGWGTLLQGDEKGPGHKEVACGEPWDGLVGE